MKQETFVKYAEIKNKIKSLTDEAKELESKVLKELAKENLATYQTEFGTFSVTTRKTWKYSEKFEEMESTYKAMLKAAQTTEQEKGIAKAEVVEGLTYRSPSNEKES